MVEHELPKLGARVRFPSPAPVLRRLLSWWWDYVLIVGWLILLFLVVALPQILGWWDLSAVWSEQTSADVAITVLTVLPYFLYLTLTELESPHATWGKRRAGIRVTGGEDGPMGGSVVLRNLVKVMPWQLGHMGTVRLVTSTEALAGAIWLQTASLVLLALIVVPIFLRKRGVHDLLAGTGVVDVDDA